MNTVHTHRPTLKPALHPVGSRCRCHEPANAFGPRPLLGELLQRGVLSPRWPLGPSFEFNKGKQSPLGVEKLNPGRLRTSCGASTLQIPVDLLHELLDALYRSSCIRGTGMQHLDRLDWHATPLTVTCCPVRVLPHTSDLQRFVRDGADSGILRLASLSG